MFSLLAALVFATAPSTPSATQSDQSAPSAVSAASWADAFEAPRITWVMFDPSCFKDCDAVVNYVAQSKDKNIENAHWAERVRMSPNVDVLATACGVDDGQRPNGFKSNRKTCSSP